MMDPWGLETRWRGGQMKNRLITLVDLGLDSSFDASMTFVQGITGNINAGWNRPVIDVNFIRSRDHETAFSALTTPSSVLHVMAHGDHSAGALLLAPPPPHHPPLPSPPLLF